MNLNEYFERNGDEILYSDIAISDSPERNAYFIVMGGGWKNPFKRRKNPVKATYSKDGYDE